MGLFVGVTVLVLLMACLCRTGELSLIHISEPTRH